MNISGQSDLDGSSERGSEEKTGSSRVAPPAANESLTTNSSSGNLFELDHSSEHAYRRGELIDCHSECLASVFHRNIKKKTRMHSSRMRTGRS